MWHRLVLGRVFSSPITTQSVYKNIEILRLVTMKGPHIHVQYNGFLSR